MRGALGDVAEIRTGRYSFVLCASAERPTQAGRLRLGNMVDPLYSVVAKIDPRPLPGTG